MKVLIVDDEPIALAMLQTALAQSGHEVFTASDGVEALAALARTGCRLVISDWEMPRMDGVELCRQVRSSSEVAGYVYFILLTGHANSTDVIRGLSAGADDFITKPFDPAELAVRVRTGERIVSIETRDVAIFAMAKLAESRDPETGAHLERVRGFCRCLSQDLMAAGQYPDQLDAEFIRLIYLTSPLHDIGKVGIPDTVLLKPGRLSDREFEIMKTHTTLGAGTLQAALDKFPAARFLQMARDIAVGHHERFDGTGYPGRLAGEQIPLAARILAVADVYDALTSRRVYKDAFSHDVAKSLINQESGSHFDPVLIEAFARCEEQFLAIRERFADVQAAA